MSGMEVMGIEYIDVAVLCFLGFVTWVIYKNNPKKKSKPSWDSGQPASPNDNFMNGAGYVQVTCYRAFGGKVLQVQEVKPQNGNNYIHIPPQMHIVRDGEKLSDAMTKVLLLTDMENK